MKIITFKTKNWQGIPKEDNPAFDYRYEDPRLQERIIGRVKRCLIICKVLPYKKNCVGKDGYSVIEVPINGDVISRGLFWHLEHAELFASVLAKKSILK